MNSIIYIRVSTTEQAEHGYSLKVQEEICTDYARRNNIEVLRIFKEKGESAKTTNRTELKKLLTYIQINSNQIDHLIVFKLDRLTRNLLDYASLIQLLSRYGIIIKSATENISDSPEGMLMQNIIASFAQYDNDQRSQRTRGGMVQALKEGRWVWIAPLGYEFKKKNQKSYLVPSKDKDKIQRIFNGFSNGRKQHEIVEDLKRVGCSISKQTINKILKNPVYIGKIRTNMFNMLIEGVHEPIIKENLFYSVQNLLNEKSRSKYKSEFSKDFPLRKFLKCPVCNRKLTGSWSKGKGGKKYPYYHCTVKGCLFKPIRKEKAEFVFIEYLKSIEPDKKIVVKFLESIRKVYDDKQKDNTAIVRVLKAAIQKLEKKAKKIEDLVIDGTFSKDQFRRKIVEVEKEIEDNKIELSNTNRTIIDVNGLLSYGEHFLSNISKLWINADLASKRKLQGLIFPEGAYIQNQELRTPRIASVFKVFDYFKSDASTMVAHRGLEPRE